MVGKVGTRLLPCQMQPREFPSYKTHMQRVLSYFVLLLHKLKHIHIKLFYFMHD